jgi:hypothetical protein
VNGNGIIHLVKRRIIMRIMNGTNAIYTNNYNLKHQLTNEKGNYMEPPLIPSFLTVSTILAALALISSHFLSFSSVCNLLSFSSSCCLSREACIASCTSWVLTGREAKFGSSGRPELGIGTEALAGEARAMIGEGAAGRVGVEPLEWG